MSKQTPPLPKTINHQLFLFAKGEISLNEFESWVYTTPALEEYLSSEDYFALISTDYSNRKNTQDILNIIKNYIDFSTQQTEYLKSELIAIIERKSNAANCLIDMYDLYCMGCYFLQKLAFEYGLLLCFPPQKYGVESWEELDEGDRQELVDNFYPAVIKDARSILELLEQEMITLSLSDKEFIRYEYEEKRPK